MKKLFVCWVMVFGTALAATAGEVDMSRLNAFAKQMIEAKKQTIGYPGNQNVELQEFYRWFADSGLADVAMNNVGNPRKPSLFSLNTHHY